jgi:uncharacterized membrane protein YoaK (UPF0700 family)
MLETQALGAHRTKSAIALLLTFIAGFVDVVGYLAIFHLFTAHVTGTTVHLGRDLMLRSWSTAAMAGCVVAGFLGGSIAGRAVIEASARFRIRRAASVNLAAEAVLLFTFISISRVLAGTSQSARVCILLGWLAMAMGLQTATLTRLGALTIHTTFVTGMINKLAQLVSHILFHTYDVWRATDLGQREHFRLLRKNIVHQALFFFSIWLVYLLGAAWGTGIYLKVGLRAICLPAILLALTIIIDQFRPLSLQEERDQSER